MLVLKPIATFSLKLGTELPLFNDIPVHVCKILSLSLPFLSGLIRHFALHNLCDLNQLGHPIFTPKDIAQPAFSGVWWLAYRPGRSDVFAHGNSEKH